jgi:hypothetical protein
MNINEIIAHAYSNHEINEKLKGKYNIITYEELNKYKTIEDAIGINEGLVILYETKHNSGHWICIFTRYNKKGQKVLSFFDPYAYNIDDQLGYIDDRFKIENNTYYPYLSLLLYNSPLPVEYNELPLQKFAKGINTCGPWVIARLKFRNLSIREFYNLFRGNKYFTSDELVALYALKL